MAQLHNDADASITEEELYIEVPFVDEGGKRSQDLVRDNICFPCYFLLSLSLS